MSGSCCCCSKSSSSVTRYQEESPIAQTREITNSALSDEIEKTADFADLNLSPKNLIGSNGASSSDGAKRPNRVKSRCYTDLDLPSLQRRNNSTGWEETGDWKEMRRKTRVRERLFIPPRRKSGSMIHAGREVRRISTLRKVTCKFDFSDRVTSAELRLERIVHNKRKRSQSFN